MAECLQEANVQEYTARENLRKDFNCLEDSSLSVQPPSVNYGETFREARIDPNAIRSLQRTQTCVPNERLHFKLNSLSLHHNVQKKDSNTKTQKDVSVDKNGKSSVKYIRAELDSILDQEGPRPIVPTGVHFDPNPVSGERCNISELIRINFVYLVDNLQMGSLCDHLYAHDVITLEDYKMVLANKEKYDRCDCVRRFLIFILSHKVMNIADFIQSLEKSGQKSIARLLFDNTHLEFLLEC